ncbi:MAG: hypothetical protein O2822_07205, partial [Chloroflexi bacterium]|nr:hypothetical protein [Chloroflexota bacterium]
PARYSADGEALDGTAPRDLHTFPGRLDGREQVIVAVATLTLGRCRAEGAVGCSPSGQPVTRSLPQTGLPPEVGRQP